MNQFCIPNKLKTIQRTSSGLIGKFTIKKKSRILFGSSFFFRKLYSNFSVCLRHLETSHFPYRGSVNQKPHLRSSEVQWTENSFSRNHSGFFGLDFWLRLESYGILINWKCKNFRNEHLVNLSSALNLSIAVKTLKISFWEFFFLY